KDTSVPVNPVTADANTAVKLTGAADVGSSWPPAWSIVTAATAPAPTAPRAPRAGPTRPAKPRPSSAGEPAAAGGRRGRLGGARRHGGHPGAAVVLEGTEIRVDEDDAGRVDRGAAAGRERGQDVGGAGSDRRGAASRAASDDGDEPGHDAVYEGSGGRPRLH